jgi:hypothetical protein
MTTTVIYKYDINARGLTQTEHIDKQLGLCRLYRNKLIELERSRRAEVNKTRRALFPDYDQLQQEYDRASAEVDKLRDEVAKANQKARRKCVTKEQRAAIKVAADSRRSVYATLRERRQALWEDPTFKTKMQEIEERHALACKEARRWISNDKGLYSYSYIGVEESLKDLRKGPPPEFRKWDGSGRLCCQIQLGKTYPFPMTWDRACSGLDSRLRVKQVDGKRWLVSVRLGSSGVGNREPVWVDCPIVLHRPLPEGSVIKWVYLLRRREGLRGNREAGRVETVWGYSLCFVITRAEGYDKEDRAEAGSVAIDVGWRLVEDGLRVAYWVGSDGREGSLVIPSERLEYARKCRDLQSIRDQHFDEIKARLLEYVAGLDEVPAWLAEGTAHLAQWRSKVKLLQLLDKWQRHAGDGEIYEALVAWRRKELHLCRWETDQREKWGRWRKDFYRCFWARLRREYRRAVVENLNVSQMRRKAGPEEERDGGLIPYRNFASVGLLLSLATMDLVKRPAEYTTVTCHKCGKVCDWDKAELRHTCEHCGADWDQDANACRNLLASGEVVDEKPSPSRGSEEEGRSADTPFGLLE